MCSYSPTSCAPLGTISTCFSSIFFFLLSLSLGIAQFAQTFPHSFEEFDSLYSFPKQEFTQDSNFELIFQ